jgi:shikimate kinase
MGSGKTTVGRLLADELGWSFADVDEDIEKEQGTSISEIFETRGEEHFRRLESAAIRQRVSMVERGRPHVVALGGGAFTIEENVTLLNANGVTLWLDCGLETARRRVESESHRPLARDPDRFAALYEARRASYRRAEFRVEAAADPAKVMAAILALPIF